MPNYDTITIRAFGEARFRRNLRRRNLIRSSVAVCFGLVLTAAVVYLEVIR